MGCFREIVVGAFVGCSFVQSPKLMVCDLCVAILLYVLCMLRDVLKCLMVACIL